MAWYKLTLLPFNQEIDNDGLDSICAELIERGASGTAIDLPPEISCFVEGSSPENLSSLALLARELGCDVISQEEVLEQNWTAACPELWEPLTAGAFQVVPVESMSDPRPVPPGALKIIPGLGFGTGHHPTTNTILSVLGEISPPQPVTRVLDLGTGSGILAVAAAKLFKAPVVAIDIDPMAAANARDNVEINGATGLVSVSTDPIASITGTFPLILANVYGEALISMSGEITRLASREGCLLILSGITELVCGQVTEAFCAGLGWRLEREISLGGWNSLILGRP
jgi:ribosomal protein L11 methyltransferase